MTRQAAVPAAARRPAATEISSSTGATAGWRRRINATRRAGTVRGEEFDDFRLEPDRRPTSLGGGRGQPAPSTAPASTSPALTGSPASSADDSTFIERLYRSTNSYADRLSPDELESIHVDLGVDDYLVEQAEARSPDRRDRQPRRRQDPSDRAAAAASWRRSAPGHHRCQRLHRRRDPGAVDACRDDGRPFVLAINEWPLYVLQRLARKSGFTPVAEALRQVTSARFFVEAPADPPTRRQRRRRRPEPAQPAVAERGRARHRPADSGPLLRRPQCRRPGDRQSRRAARPAGPRSGWSKLLELVATRTGHVTMRQLVGFVAYLITAGQSATDRVRAGQDTHRARLLQPRLRGRRWPTVRRGPRRSSIPPRSRIPIWDDRLWLGDTDARDWLASRRPRPMTLNESERNTAYRAIKRRFFFEHTERRPTCSTLVPTDERSSRRRSLEGAAGDRRGRPRSGAGAQPLLRAGLPRHGQGSRPALAEPPLRRPRAVDVRLAPRALVPAPAHRAAQDGAVGRGVAAPEQSTGAASPWSPPGRTATSPWSRSTASCS